MCSNDTFVLTGRNPDRVLGADLVMWRRERIPGGVQGLIPEPPDLVAEVRRPFDTIPDIQTKAAEYLAAGVPVVLVLDPESESVETHRPARPPERFGPADELTLPDVLPGFAVPVRRFFE